MVLDWLTVILYTESHSLTNTIAGNVSTDRLMQVSNQIRWERLFQLKFQEKGKVLKSVIVFFFFFLFELRHISFRGDTRNAGLLENQLQLTNETVPIVHRSYMTRFGEFPYQCRELNLGLEQELLKEVFVVWFDLATPTLALPFFPLASRDFLQEQRYNTLSLLCHLGCIHQCRDRLQNRTGCCDCEFLLDCLSERHVTSNPWPLTSERAAKTKAKKRITDFSSQSSQL